MLILHYWGLKSERCYSTTSLWFLRRRDSLLVQFWTSVLKFADFALCTLLYIAFRDPGNKWMVVAPPPPPPLINPLLQ